MAGIGLMLKCIASSNSSYTVLPCTEPLLGQVRSKARARGLGQVRSRSRARGLGQVRSRARAGASEI